MRERTGRCQREHSNCGMSERCLSLSFQSFQATGEAIMVGRPGGFTATHPKAEQ